MNIKKKMNYQNSYIFVIKSIENNYEYIYELDYGACSSDVSNNTYMKANVKTIINYSTDSGNNSRFYLLFFFYLFLFNGIIIFIR